ncbi:hypothetical protein KR100_09320 [Synechococcus sp. KORDI-100]|nr:hypothetical protein KR100_09320 [Synechococcus sp. KORDI-100]
MVQLFVIGVEISFGLGAHSFLERHQRSTG